jgi:hypothetical protein
MTAFDLAQFFGTGEHGGRVNGAFAPAGTSFTVCGHREPFAVTYYQGEDQ